MLEVLLHLLALLNRMEDNDNRELCLLGLSYSHHFGINIFQLKLTIDVQSRHSFMDSSFSCENYGVFEESREFGLALTTSESGSHANDCVLVEDDDC